MNPIASTSSYQVKDKEISQRFQFLQHAGKEILLLDYSHADRKTCLALTAEFDRYLSGLQPDASLRILFDMESPYYDPAHVNHWKSSSARYEKYFHSTAMIHAGSIFRMILNGLRAYLNLIGRPMSEKRGRLFADKAAALEFLSQD